MNTSKAGIDGLQIILCPCALDEICLTVNPLMYVLADLWGYFCEEKHRNHSKIKCVNLFLKCLVNLCLVDQFLS